MTDADAKNTREGRDNGPVDEIDAERVEDLDVDEHAEAVLGGVCYCTVCIGDQEGTPQIE